MRPTSALVVLVAASCVYFNAMYDANRAYEAGARSLQEQSEITARIEFDSVIAKTGRIIEDHPDSKYADDAAILKTRAELNNRMWESAVETAVKAEELAGDPKMRALALGLRGVALQELGAYRTADSLLSLGLAVEVDADDEALFLFQRGLARQRLGLADLATIDLEAAANSVELSREGSLMLSIALRDIGEFERSVELTGRLLVTANPSPQSPLYLHVDSLAVLSPALVDSVARALLETPALSATRRAAFHYIAGRAQLESGHVAQALASFDAAGEEAATSQAASDAAYYAIQLRLASASRPEDVTALLGSFSAPRRASSRATRDQALRWERAALEYAELVTAYEGRGASAAEAVLRAAEIARIDLGSAALARGSYLLYLELVPDSRWAAKAVYGALSVSGHPPDPGWIVDRGSETDDELRAILDGLPLDDPYRLAIVDGGGDAMADSMYVLAEADLRRRLIEIRTLFDPTAADTVPVEEVAPVERGDEIDY